LDDVLAKIAAIKARAAEADTWRPTCPMITLRTPKGWTCPPVVDGKRVEDSWRAHQVPLAEARATPEHLEVLRGWLASYRPGELFDDDGAAGAGGAGSVPVGRLRLADNRDPPGGARAP